MKLQWNLPGFSLDLENLWNISEGPSVSKELPHFAEHHKSLNFKTTSKSIGFYDWPVEISVSEIDSMKDLALEIRQTYEGAILFGIGGSYLGAASLLQALRTPEEEGKFPLHWLSNVDRTSIERSRAFIQKKNAAAVLISKSGNTIETLSGFYHLGQAFDRGAIIAVTDPQSGELRKLVKKNSWKSFPVPPNIGGRFSVLTAVGLFPLLLGGIDIDPILNGARKMREHLNSFTPDDNPAYLYAYSKYLWDTKFKHSIQYMMPYESGLQLFGSWYVQLWGESLGKKTLRAPYTSVGPTPVAALGTTDQHSLLQLFKEGPKDKIIGFVTIKPKEKTLIGNSPFASPDFSFLCHHSFEEVNSLACLATEKSLHNSNTPTYRFELPSLGAETLGALIFFLQTACAFSGELYGIDAFNQPGVEEAKNLLCASL